MIHLKTKHIRLVEFFVVGVLAGLLEDLIAIAVATDTAINLRVILMVLAIAIPFAVLSELVVDHPRFWRAMRVFKKEEGENASAPASKRS